MSSCVLFVLALTTRAIAEPASMESASQPESESDVFSIIEEQAETELTVAVATRVAQKLSETPAIVTVIARDDLRSGGYRNIGEALADVAGLYIIDDLLTNNVAVRGIYAGADSWSRVVKVLVDGQPATSFGNGGNLLGDEFIPLDAVQSIEVIRGPGSALYGANAFLGVINIITREPSADAHVRVSNDFVLIRNRPGDIVNLSGGVSDGKEKPSSVFVAASAGYLDRSGLAVPSTSPAALDFASQLSAGDLSRPVSVYGKARWSFGAGGTIAANALYQRQDVFGEFTEQSILSHGNRIVQQNLALTLDYRLMLWHDKLSIHAYVGYSQARSLPEQVLQVQNQQYSIRRERLTDTPRAGVDLSLNLGQYHALVGVDFMHAEDRGDTTSRQINVETSTFQPGDRQLISTGSRLVFLNVGPYAQLIANPLPWLGLTVGARYDVNSIGGNAPSLRGGVVFQPMPGMNVKLLYGGSYVPPAFTQLTATQIGPGSSVGAPNLRSQSAHTGEVAFGYRYKEHVNIELNGFVTAIKDRIESVQAGVLFTSQNLTDSLSLGGELTVKGGWRFLFASSSLSLQMTQLIRPQVAPLYWDLAYAEDGPLGSSPAGYPVWIVRTKAGVRFPQYKFEASFTVRAVGERKSSVSNIRAASEAYMLPAYGTLDVVVRTLDLTLWGKRKTEFAIVCRNLFDARYAEAGGSGVDLPVVGRTFLLRVAQEF